MGENEEVLWWAHPSFVMHFPPIVLGGFIAIASILVQFVPVPMEIPLKVRVGILAGGIVLGASLILYELIRRRHIYYVVTTNKLWHTHGIISTDRNPVRYDRVVNVRVTQSYLERILSYFLDENIGEVYVMTADDEGGDMLLENVPRIEMVSQMIEDGMEGAVDPDHARRGGAAARTEGFTNGSGNRQPNREPPQNERRQQNRPPQGQQGQRRGQRNEQRPPRDQQRGRGGGGGGGRFPDAQPDQSQPPRDQNRPPADGRGGRQGQGQNDQRPPEDDGRYPDAQSGGEPRQSSNDDDDSRYPDQ